MLIPITSWHRTAFFACISAVILVTKITGGSAQTNHSPHDDLASNHSVNLTQPLTSSWRYESNLTLNLTPAADGERVYLPLAGGMVVSLIAATGQLNWRSEMGGELSASPVADERG